MATIQVADKPTLDRIETKVDAIKADTGFSTIVALPAKVSVSAPDAGWHSIYKVTGAGEAAIQKLKVEVSKNTARKAKIEVDGKGAVLSPNPYSTTSFIDSGFSNIKFSKSFEIFIGAGTAAADNVASCEVSGLIYLE